MISWYALHVRSNCEGLVAAALRAQGIEQYYPVSTTGRNSESGRTRTYRNFGEDAGSSIITISGKRSPIFPGYVFGAFDPSDSRHVVSIPHVVRILPGSIEDSEIQSIRMMAESPVPMHEHPFLTSGERVRVLYGPLVGAVGFVERIKKSTRIVCSISLLGRSIAVEVDAGQLESIGGNGDAAGRLAA